MLSLDFNPAKIIEQSVKDGRLGRKTGRGLYEWDKSGRIIIKEVQVEEKTRKFLEDNIDPELGLATRMNEGCRLLEMGVVKGYELINKVDLIGNGREGPFVQGINKYMEWSDKLETMAEKLNKHYLKPCDMMKSGRFKNYP